MNTAGLTSLRVDLEDVSGCKIIGSKVDDQQVVGLAGLKPSPSMCALAAVVPVRRYRDLR